MFSSNSEDLKQILKARRLSQLNATTGTDDVGTGEQTRVVRSL